MHACLKNKIPKFHAVRTKVQVQRFIENIRIYHINCLKRQKRVLTSYFRATFQKCYNSEWEHSFWLGFLSTYSQVLPEYT
jgi:hypothetical protein